MISVTIAFVCVQGERAAQKSPVVMLNSGASGGESRVSMILAEVTVFLTHRHIKKNILALKPLKILPTINFAKIKFYGLSLIFNLILCTKTLK